MNVRHVHQGSLNYILNICDINFLVWEVAALLWNLIALIAFMGLEPARRRKKQSKKGSQRIIYALEMLKTGQKSWTLVIATSNSVSGALLAHFSAMTHQTLKPRNLLFVQKHRRLYFKKIFRSKRFSYLIL